MEPSFVRTKYKNVGVNFKVMNFREGTINDSVVLNACGSCVYNLSFIVGVSNQTCNCKIVNKYFRDLVNGDFLLLIMPMQSPSSGIEDRFSKIDIESPRVNKSTQSHSKTTVPRLPNLSTSRRAEARGASNIPKSTSTNNIPTGLYMTKTPTRATNNTAALTGKKYNRLNMVDSRSSIELSYMRDTSSSSMRKLTSPFNSTASPMKLKSRLINSRSMKDLSDQRYPSIANRRIISLNPRPLDITNLDLEKPRSRADQHNVSPSKRPAPLSFPSPSKQDVYTRLYNDSKSKAQPVIHSQKLQNTRPTPANVEQVRKDSNPLDYDGMVSRIESLDELYGILYNEDSELFEENESNEFNVNESKTSSEIATINSDETNSTSLDIYERGEILRRKDIYCLPDLSEQTSRRINIRNYNNNYGFDDNSGNYVVIPRDHIKYRYEITAVLGNGSFGNVVKCWDKKYSSKDNKNKIVAIKIIKNDLNWSVQAVYEIKMLQHLNGIASKMAVDDPYSNEYGNRDCPVLTYYDHFNFRGHMCIVTEALSLNLYSMMEIVKFKGLSLDLLGIFMKKILVGLEYIHSMNVLHCDIKPENIMIKLPPASKLTNLTEQDLVVKIVDFGTSCFKNEVSFSYIQSRFYRAPEVILGAKYDRMIDIWSFGCIATELFTGEPLLPGKNELEQIAFIIELFGAPNSSLVLNQRNLLMKSIREERALNKLDDRVISNPSTLPVCKGDEKSIRKTLLYTLFDMEGKINMQFLNMRIQAAQHTTAPTNSKKIFKISSKSLPVRLRLRSSNDTKVSAFIKLLERIFIWDPTKRADAAMLLRDPFFT